MTARAEFPIRMVPAIVLAIAAMLGVLAGADPGMALIGWIAMSAAWADHTSAVVDTVIRYVPNAMLFFIVFSAIRDRDQVLLLVGAFVVGALVSAAYGLAVPTSPEAGGRLSGGVGNANETAAARVAGTGPAAALLAALEGKHGPRLPALRVVA